MRTPLTSSFHRRLIGRLSVGAALTGSLVLAGGAFGAAAVTSHLGQGLVGQSDADGVLLPTGQHVKPLGRRTLVDNGRLLSSTLSPDGKTLAAQTWNNGTVQITLVDVASGKIRQQVGMGAKVGDSTVAADGPVYSPDGRSLWASQSGDVVRLAVNSHGDISGTTAVIKLGGPFLDSALPSGGAFSADGSKLYIALNANNTLGVIDTRTNTLLREIPVGNAPRQVVVVGNSRPTGTRRT